MPERAVTAAMASTRGTITATVRTRACSRNPRCASPATPSISPPGSNADGFSAAHQRIRQSSLASTKRQVTCYERALARHRRQCCPGAPRLDLIFGVGESAERWFPGQESASPEDPAETAMSV
jgi:hypothetical protein